MAALPAEVGDSSPALRQSDLFDGIGGLGVLRQAGLMIGLAASVALGFAVVLWSQDEDYMPLYANLDQMDPTDVLNTLQANQIQYKVDTKTGALLVVSNQIYDARLKLAGAGISPDGSFGLEMLDKEQPLGTSQFMESARFKRGLEGELARTISSIRSVRNARVHLAIPKTSAFIRDKRKPSASVLLSLYNGRAIQSEKVRAIANLVSSSIPELMIDAVTVVDQQGNLLSNFTIDAEMAIANKQLEYTSQYESRLADRIGSILVPVLGDDGFRAKVSVDLDFTQVEQTDELFNPDLPAIRSEQTIEETRSNSSEGGVPGALTNQPPAGGQIANQGGVTANTGGNSRRQAVRNYELDRTISHTKHQVGRLRRLSVAVLVDNISKRDPESGEISSTPVDLELLNNLTTLIKNTVGYSEARGDSVSIINSAFIPKVPIEELIIEEAPVWEQTWALNIAKQVGGGLFLLLLVFGLLRPVMRGLTDNAQEIREMEAQRALGELSGDLGGGLEDETVTLSGGDGLLLGGPNENFDQQLNAVKGLVAEDPGRVAQVVKKWVAASE